MELFQDPTFRLWYIAGGMLLLDRADAVAQPLVSPQHRGSTAEGGRAADAAPAARAARARTRSPDLGEAVGMARDIASGRYGQHARRMQNKVYWVAGLWVVALTVYFGLLIWADEMARVAPAPLSASRPKRSAPALRLRRARSRQRASTYGQKCTTQRRTSGTSTAISRTPSGSIHTPSTGRNEKTPPIMHRMASGRRRRRPRG